MRFRKYLQKGSMPSFEGGKIMPARPRICELLGRQGTPVAAAQLDDKRVGGRVESRNSAALIGRDPKIPTEVRHLILNVRKFA